MVPTAGEEPLGLKSRCCALTFPQLVSRPLRLPVPH